MRFLDTRLVNLVPKVRFSFDQHQEHALWPHPKLAGRESRTFGSSAHFHKFEKPASTATTDLSHAMSKQKILPVQPLIHCETRRAMTKPFIPHGFQNGRRVIKVYRRELTKRRRRRQRGLHLRRQVRVILITTRVFHVVSR